MKQNKTSNPINTKIPQFLQDLGVTKVQSTSYSWFDKGIDKKYKITIKYFKHSQIEPEIENRRVIYFNYVDYYVKNNNNKWELYKQFPYRCDEITETFDVKKCEYWSLSSLQEHLENWQKTEFKILTQGYYLKKDFTDIGKKHLTMTVDIDGELFELSGKYYTKYRIPYLLLDYRDKTRNKYYTLWDEVVDENNTSLLYWEYLEEHVHNNYKKIMEVLKSILKDPETADKNQLKRKTIEKALQIEEFKRDVESTIKMSLTLPNTDDVITYVGVVKYDRSGWQVFEQFADVYFGSIFSPEKTKIDTIDLRKFYKSNSHSKELNTMFNNFREMIEQDFNKRFKLDENFKPYLVKFKESND